MLSTALALYLLAAPPAPGHDTIVGEAASAAAEQKLLVNKDGGGQVVVSIDDKTTLLRALPGAKTLEGASPVQAREIAAGDRLLCRGTLDASGNALAANRIVVMARGDVEARRQKEREDWQKRGVAGVVSAVDPAAKEITLRTRDASGGTKSIVIEAGGQGVTFRRYAAASVRYADALPGSLDQVGVGDQVRVLGNRNADGSRMTAEQVVSGAFRVVRGVVAEVDPAAGTLSVRENGKSVVTVAVGPETLLRRLPPMMVMRLLRGSEGASAAGTAGATTAPGEGHGAPGASPVGAPAAAMGQTGPPADASHGQRPPATGAPGTGIGAPAGAAPGAAAPGTGAPGAGGPGGARGWAGAGGGWSGRPPDPDEALERLPATTLAQLNKGDEVAVLGPRSSDGTSWPAIKLAAWTLPSLPNAAGGGRGGGRGRSEGLGGGADPFSDVLGFGGDTPW